MPEQNLPSSALPTLIDWLDRVHRRNHEYPVCRPSLRTLSAGALILAAFFSPILQATPEQHGPESARAIEAAERGTELARAIEAAEQGTELARALEAAERGTELARAVEAAERGFGDFTVSGRMFLRDAEGRENERSFTLRALETGEGGTRNLFVFDGPPDIRGVALLTVDPASNDLQQWLYLPAMQRTRRISTGHRGSAFAGSELAYEDFISEVAERSRHRWLREAPCPGQTPLICQIVERVPETLTSAYGRQELWIDTVEYRIHQIDYHDRNGLLLKTLTLDDYHLHDSRFWRPLRLRMTHQHTGRETEILWNEYRFATGLNVNDFTVRALERLR